MNTFELTDHLAVPLDSKPPFYETKLPGFSGLNELDINSLIDLIVKQYHFNARQDLAVIYELAQKVFSMHCDKYPELAKLVETLFLFFDDLLFHLKKEEQILFPNIIQLTEKKLHEQFFTYSTFGVIKEYAAKMQHEHKEVIKQLAFIRRLTNDYREPEGNCKAFHLLFTKMKKFEIEMLHHIELENIFLFPRAIQLDEK
jgi:regulator of cell morphogenesis and NO signaling